MKFRQYIFVVFLLLPSLYGWTQAAFSTITDELTLRKNELLQVQYIVENAEQIEKFQAPDFRDFKVMHGPVETNGMTLVNGKLYQYKAFTYVLQPLQTGRLTVPGALAVIDGKKMQSNKVIVEVDEASAAPPANPYPMNPGISSFRRQAEEDYILGPGENAVEKIRNNLLVKLELDKTSAYVGEPIVAIYKLYTRLRSESRVVKRPSMNGFSVYDMIDPDGAGPQTEVINGQVFQVHIIRKTQLFPLQEGDFVLEPVELENVVRFLKTGNSPKEPSDRTPLERMFDDLLSDEPMGEWEEYRVTLSSRPQSIHIKPLPPGAPAGFDGAVGKFTIKGQLKDSSVPAGENVVYELSIEGSGNLPLVNAPQWPLPGGMEKFDPVVKEELDKSKAPMEGSKQIQYTFTPSKSGSFVLPAIEFSYFDPASATYRTIHSDSSQLTVTVSAKRNLPPSLPAKPEKGNLTGILLWSSGLAGLTGGVLALILLAKRNRKRRRQAILPSVPTVIEPKLPADRLAGAKAAVASNDVHEYYREVEKAIWDEVAEKLTLPGSMQQKPLAMQLLAARGLPQSTLQELNDCWRQCERALYMPEYAQQIDHDLLARTERLLEEVKRQN